MQRGVRTRDRCKYVCLEGQPILMLDLNEDPYEMTNLAQWLEKTGDEFPLPELLLDYRA